MIDLTAIDQMLLTPQDLMPNYKLRFDSPPEEVPPELDAKLYSKADVRFQGNYLQLRFPVLEALQQIADETFEFDSAVEIGAGVFGWVNNFLLPNVEIIQTEIHPKAIEYNKQFTERHFGETPTLINADSYNLPFQDGSVEVIVGANALDTPCNLETQISEIDRCIAPGGHFVHYQDVLPVGLAMVFEEQRRRLKKGYDKRVPCRYFKSRGSKPMLVGIESVDFGLVHVSEYLNRCIAQYFEENGYKVINCENHTPSLLGETARLDEMYERFKQHDPFFMENFFEYSLGLFFARFDPTIPAEHYHQKADMMVLKVQKPN